MAVDRTKVPNIDHLIELYLGGASEKQVAKVAGVSRNVIRRHLLKRGIEPRGRSEAENIKWAKIRATPGGVERQCGRAWQGRRGDVDGIDVLIKRAKTRMKRLLHRGHWEADLLDALSRRGVSVVPQYAIGPRNLDLALDEARVAVEVLGSKHGRRFAARFCKRTEDLLDLGWAVVWLVAYGRCEVDAVAEYLVAYANGPSRDDAAARQYRVIGGDAKPTTDPSLDFDSGASIARANTGNE